MSELLQDMKLVEDIYGGMMWTANLANWTMRLILIVGRVRYEATQPSFFWGLKPYRWVGWIKKGKAGASQKNMGQKKLLLTTRN